MVDDLNPYLDSPDHQGSEADRYWMAQALIEAAKAAEMGEVPVGAVLVDAAGECVARGFNHPIDLHDPSAHAEIAVLRAAGQAIQNYRLVNTTLYVTIEPCAMCVGAIVHARVGRLVFGATEPKAGAVVSQEQLADKHWLNHQPAVTGGVLADEASALMSQFFKQRRAARQTAKQSNRALAGRSPKD